MRKFLILVLIGLVASNQAISQLYIGHKGWRNCFVEINKDSAHVEIFSVSPPDFTAKNCDEILFSINNVSDACFEGRSTKIIKNRSYYLFYKPNYRKRPYKIKLKSCTNDNRKKFRNEAYASDKRIMIRNLNDSLSGPKSIAHLDINNPIRRVTQNHLSDSNFVDLVDSVSDSLIKIILTTKDSLVDYYYIMSDSINKLDSINIYKLLANGAYNYPFEKYFMYRLSLTRPDYLIRYVDKDPVNKKSLLKAIRNHNNYKEIIKKVKETPLKSTGKKEIQKQKAKRIMTDFAIGTAYVSIILSEVALLTGIIIWIF